MRDKLIKTIKWTMFFIAVALLFLNISLVSSMYVGETNVYPNEFQKDNLIYTIIDNTSYITYPIVEINLTNISITIPDNSNPNSYKIVFIENNTQTIVQTIQVSTGNGGGHSHKTKIINQTKEVEVDNYVTEYIDNSSCSLNSSCSNSSDNKWKEIKEPTKKTWIIAIISILLIIVLLYIFIVRMNKKYLNELNKKEFRTGEEE